MTERFISHSLAVVAIGLGLSACRGTNPQDRFYVSPHFGEETSSPWQTAVGLRAALNVLPEANRHVGQLLALGSVQRQWFDGGHDNVFSFGLQGRRTVNENGTVLGLEALYNNWRVSDGFFDPVATVFGLGAIAAQPLGGSGVSAWAGFDLLFFGDFTTDGNVVYEGGGGYQFNIGLEFDVGRLSAGN